MEYKKIIKQVLKSKHKLKESCSDCRRLKNVMCKQLLTKKINSSITWLKMLNILYIRMRFSIYEKGIPTFTDHFATNGCETFIEKRAVNRGYFCSIKLR